jgi:hypothetical protein
MEVANGKPISGVTLELQKFLVRTLPRTWPRFVETHLDARCDDFDQRS